ncbi:MAG: hypothetical protein COA44_10420 [Arcobacter sp.]|nr:MAG: hypothetical protein COA44_10420 [Arcobacter sp.]
MIKTLEMHNLSCGGCAETVRTALEIAGFTEINVNLRHEPHIVSAEIKDDAHLELLKKVLRDHGYPLLTDEQNLDDCTNLNFS